MLNTHEVVLYFMSREHHFILPSHGDRADFSTSLPFSIKITILLDFAEKRNPRVREFSFSAYPTNDV